MIQYPAQLDGVLTRVLEAGRGDRYVVFVHGMGARADRWKANMEAMASAGFHAYAVDMPGHGFAQKGAVFEYTVPAYASFVEAFLDSIGAASALLVGTSLGGNVMAYLACRSPRRAAGLVLVGSLGLAPLARETRERLCKTLMDASIAGTRQKLQRLLFSQQLLTDEWAEEECRINTSPGAAEAFRKLADYVLAEPGINEHCCIDALERLAATIPVLLVWGSDDRSVPVAVGDAAHARLPASNYVVLRESAHAPYLERAQAFNEAVLKFCHDRMAGKLGGQKHAQAHD